MGCRFYWNYGGLTLLRFTLVKELQSFIRIRFLHRYEMRINLESCFSFCLNMQTTNISWQPRENNASADDRTLPKLSYSGLRVG